MSTPNLTFPLIAKYTVVFVIALFTSEGIKCFDWETVDTGIGSSPIPPKEELRDLIPVPIELVSDEQ